MNNSLLNNVLNCGDKNLDISSPKVMGILNVTPDSFSDGGDFLSIDSALYQVEKMINDGASIIDIGGESTKPNAIEVSAEQELNRVIPVLSAIKARFDIIVSIDTSKALVMKESILNGAGMINDVYALQNEGCLDVMALSTLPVCLMHMQGKPSTMQDNPRYVEVIKDIYSFFEQRILQCSKSGIHKQRIILDPGFGFGKTLEQNYQILAKLNEFSTLGLPILSGTSRKSMIGNLLNCDVKNRLAGSITTAILAVQQGAKIIRVHDVKETVDALTVLKTTQNFY